MGNFDEYREELEKLGLSTKDDLRKLLKPLLLDAIKFEPVKGTRPLENSQLISHFGGLPYFENGESWPIVKDGWQKDMPLYFIFQIINDGKMTLPKHIKILQFFITYPETPFETDDGGWLVKTYESISPEKLAVVEGPKSKYNPIYKEIKFSNIKSLPTWDGIEKYSPEAEKLVCVLDENGGNNFEDVVTELCGEHNICSAIGGYPHWIQSDQTPTDPKDKKLPLLFQLDSESDAGLSWGDAGLLYIFYNPNKKGHYEFITQDC